MASAKIKELAGQAINRLAALRGSGKLPAGLSAMGPLSARPRLALPDLSGLSLALRSRLAALRSSGAPAEGVVAAVPRTPHTRLDLQGLPRKVALVVAVVGVALGAGQFVQSQTGDPARAEAGTAPRDIVALSAGAKPSVAVLPQARPEVSALPEPAVQAEAAPIAPKPEEMMLAEAPSPEPEAAPVPAAQPDCDVTLTAMVAPGAMIDVVMLAPCAPQSAVVVRHAGLAVSARTSVSGALFLSLPGLDAEGRVSLRLEDGTELDAAAPIDLTGIRRHAVQWQADDRFQLHALEGAAGYGDPGHLWSGAAGGSDRLLSLGDPSVPLPLLAEVYTYPADPARSVRLTIEAEVTGTACARDILGETLASERGRVTVTEVTLSMPACDAVGDFLVLNNPLPETTLAAAATD